MKYFSPGWKYVTGAQSSWKRGDFAKSLFSASEAIRLDAKLVEAKIFLKDHHDIGMKNINSRLNSLNIKNIDGAKSQVIIYSNLDKYFSNLKVISLPLKDEEGQWEWTTDILDYSSKLIEARKNAYKVYRENALKLISRGEIEKAEKFFGDAVSKYQEASKVRDSKAEMKKTFTKAYYLRGLNSEKQNNIKSLELAVRDYRKSLSWDKNNKLAYEHLQRSKAKLVEIYYKDGRKYEKKDKNKAVEAYSNSLRWVEGYKDAVERLKVLVISEELNELKKNLKISEYRLASIASKPKNLSRNISKASDVLNKLTYISDTLRKADTDMTHISRTLKAFNVIPTVNNFTKIAGKIVRDGDRPVHGMVLKFNSVERPVITPLKNSVASLATISANMATKVQKIDTVVRQTRMTINEIQKCLEKQKNPKALIKAGQDAKEINKGLVQANKVLNTTNRSLDRISSGVKTIARLQPLVKKVADASRKIGKPIKDIGKATHEIDKVLDKKISIKIFRKRISTSVRKILTGAVPKIVKKLLNKFSKLAMKALDPVLKKLKIRIPKIKGIDQLKRDLNKLSGAKRNIDNRIGKIKAQIMDVDKYSGMIKKKLYSIEKAACSR